MGRGEAAEQPDAQAFWDGEATSGAPERPSEAGPDRGKETEGDTSARENGVVIVDFRGLGPDAA